MLTIHRNAFLKIIQEANIDYRKFNVTNVALNDGSSALRIEVRDSDLYFMIWSDADDAGHNFRYKFSTYKRSNSKPEYHYYEAVNTWYSLDYVKSQFKDWFNKYALKYLAHQQEEEEDKTTPDLWTELMQSSDLLLESEATENSFFTLEEQERLVEDLKSFENNVKDQKLLTEEQFHELQNRIEYLIDSSKRLGRKDWLNITIGQLLSFMFQAKVMSEVATQIMILAGEAISWVSHHIPALPPLIL